MPEPRHSFKSGDRVKKADGTTATVVAPPLYYKRARGDSFTRWAVVIELDDSPEIVLSRIERGLTPGTREIARLENLTLISEWHH